ncbi:MAG: MBL fold metallo-hydrolase [Rhodospirillales bacterium]|nr:MBL fold metallo-hydrolase [Rhodospirillales bacterium]
MKLKFLGATGTVTGSKYLLQHDNKKLLVDCGLFQGLKELRLRNWAKLPVDPASIDAVVLTHAHIDHSGYLPLLVKNGFTGPVYCSEATYDLCRILLPDSGYLHEADARRANKYAYSKHKPALALYTQKDAEACLQQFTTIPFGKPHELPGGLNLTLSRAGHILGSSFVRISDNQTTLVFSGDIGRAHDPVMNAPAIIQDADYLVLESTYGDRLHGPADPLEMIGEIIRDTAARGGSIIIPAFAVGRAQSLLYYVHELLATKAIPVITVYLDSPMAINTTGLLCKHLNEHRLPENLCAEVSHVAKYVRTAEESKALDHQNGMPVVIISASGMATGGRILHHLKYFLGDHRNTILFTGFQAAGTRGARLLAGEEKIKIHGKMWPVRAQIETLHNISAHADYGEILNWLGNFRAPPRKTFITHGEPAAALSLKTKIEAQLGWQVEVPEYLQEVEL